MEPQLDPQPSVQLIVADSLVEAHLAAGRLARAGDERFDAPVEVCLIR